MPRQRAPKLPKAIQDALSGLPAVAPRLNGLATPPLGLAALRIHAAALKEICEYIALGLDSADLVLEAMATQRDKAVALVQLAAFACRMDITGGIPELGLHETAHASLGVIGAIAAAGVWDASGRGRAVAADLSWAFLKGHNLHASAKQAASAAAVLASRERQAGLSAGTPGSLGRFRLRAGQMAGATMALVSNLVAFVREHRDRALVEAVLLALRESRLLEHTGRVLLLLPPGPGEDPAPEALVEAQHMAHYYLSSAFILLRGAEDSVSSSPDSELKRIFGRCGLHALLALGASSLAAADGAPCGLPGEPLLRWPRELPFASVSGECIAALACTLTADLQIPAPRPSSRARIRMPVRVLRLAGASARARRVALVLTRDGKLVVDLSWSGGRLRGSQQFARLLGRDRITDVASVTIAELVSSFTCCPRACAAEAGPLLAAYFTGARHCLAGLSGEETLSPRSPLRCALPHLLTTVAQSLLLDQGSENFIYELMMWPSGLSAEAAAALEGGVVPLLETLLRAAGDEPAGTEGHMARRLLCELCPCSSLVALLVHSPPRQAAAFLATLSKLLRRTPPAALLEPTPPQDGPLVPGAWLAATDQLVPLISNAADKDKIPEPPDPVDPAAPCSPLFVLCLAALQLLPVVSRLTREAALLARAQPATAEQLTGAAAAGGSAQTAGQGGVAVDSPSVERSGLLSEYLLRILTGALRRATAGLDAGPASPNPLAAALCLPFLVEEAGAVPLLGALLATLLRDGELPGAWPTPPDLLWLLAEGCLGVATGYPERVRGEGGSGSAGAGGSSEPPASASAAWPPVALRLLASRLRGSEPQLSEEVEALATRLEQPPTAEERLLEGNPVVAELAAEAERLAALRAEVRAVLPPACSNPACASLAGDSEAALRLQQCGRCGRASYCCRECQVAHWKAGHKEACGGGGEGGGPKTG